MNFVERTINRPETQILRLITWSVILTNQKAFFTSKAKSGKPHFLSKAYFSFLLGKKNSLAGHKSVVVEALQRGRKQRTFLAKCSFGSEFLSPNSCHSSVQKGYKSEEHTCARGHKFRVSCIPPSRRKFRIFNKTPIYPPLHMYAKATMKEQTRLRREDRGMHFTSTANNFA